MKVLEFNMKIWSQFGGAGVQYADSGVTAENGIKRSGTETFWNRGWHGGVERRAPKARSETETCQPRFQKVGVERIFVPFSAVTEGSAYWTEHRKFGSKSSY